MTAHSTDLKQRPRSTDTTTKPSSTAAMTKTSPTSPLMGQRKPWRPWQDWVNVALGLYLLLAPLWTAGAPTGWFVTIGILSIAVAVWAAGTGSSSAAEWSQIIVGVVLFLAPWFGNFVAASAAAAVSPAAWTAWIIGAALAVLAATAMYQNRSGKEHITAPA